MYQDDLCTYSEFKNMSTSERNEYIRKIYNGKRKYKVYAEVIKILERRMAINPIYFLIDDVDGKIALDFNLFYDNYKLADIGAGIGAIKENTYGEFCENRNIHEHDKIICTICIEKNAFELEKEHYFSFYPKTIDTNVEDIQTLFKRYALPYKPEIYNHNTDEAIKLAVNMEDELKHKLGDLEYKIDDKKAELNMLQEQHDRELKEYRDKINEEEAELDKKLEKKKKELKLFECYNVSLDIIDENEIEKFTDAIDIQDFDELISYVQGYLNQNEGLQYPIDVLQNYYFGLQTDLLILFIGKPGTGKTSLAEAFSKVFDFADTVVVSVQSNWNDKGDLLGYYNPLEKDYVPTYFVEKLIEYSKLAAEHPEKLYLFCLDEMNLAHIEYYFAEFLSVLQRDRCLQLYSDKIRQDIVRELKYSGFTDLDSCSSLLKERLQNNDLSLEERKYYLSLCRMANMLVKYPAKFTIPKNIKFVGTLNQDATTLDISPKVLDRSFVIRLNNFTQIDIDAGDYSKKLKYKELDSFAENDNIENNHEIFEKNVRIMNDIVKFSARSSNQSIKHPNRHKWESVIGLDRLNCWIIQGIFLPKLRIFAEEYSEKIEKIRQVGNKYPVVKAIIEEIDRPEEEVIDYWGS